MRCRERNEGEEAEKKPQLHPPLHGAHQRWASRYNPSLPPLNLWYAEATEGKKVVMYLQARFMLEKGMGQMLAGQGRAAHTPCHEPASFRTCKNTDMGLPDPALQHSCLPGSGFVITSHSSNSSEYKGNKLSREQNSTTKIWLIADT